MIYLVGNPRLVNRQSYRRLWLVPGAGLLNKAALTNVILAWPQSDLILLTLT